MGDRTLNVLLEEPMIEGDRFRKLLDAAVGFAAKTATPGLTGHASHSRVARWSVHKLLA